MASRIIEADCIEAMAEMEEASVDAVVCDPPAGISFMGKRWDSDRSGGFVEWLASVMREALRVAKPGAHAVVWALPRTCHWTGSAIEAAGWDVRDVITHHFGSGFPKSHNLANGWGTALKPATEFYFLARKPLVGTVAANVLSFGTGALNVDGCRIGADTVKSRKDGGFGENFMDDEWQPQPLTPYEEHSGRWPANCVLSHLETCERVGVRRVKGSHDQGKHEGRRGHGTAYSGRWPDFEDGAAYADPDGTEQIAAWRCAACPVAELDRQSGERPAGVAVRHNSGGKTFGGENPKPPMDDMSYGDTGGASRFFYTAKASRGERNAGLEGFEERAALRDGARFNSGGRTQIDGEWVETSSEPQPKANVHPTVKPIDLMRWLCRLVTPPGATILDPFMGSGTTGIAAHLEGFDFIGIEREPEYAEIARARIAWWERMPPGTAVDAALGLDVSERTMREAGQDSLFG